MRPHPSLLALAVLLASPAAHATFDWGGDCSAGIGNFQQPIAWQATVEVGAIPENKRDVAISLDSPTDVDIQLIDAATGTEIIAWPNGLLNGPSEDCTTFEGVTYCWSGYNGDQTPGGFGQEWIEVRGDTNRELVLEAFGYQAGAATLDYEYFGVPTCNEIGEGSFDQYLSWYSVEDVGVIPVGKANVNVALQAAGGADIDIQLFHGSTPIVQWPNGLLSGPTAGQVEYQGMTIEYSGYNGIGGNWGHEDITITGELTTALTVKAFAYQAGTADVDYTWGAGAGATCLGIANLQCDAGLQCKAVQVGVADAAGSCHTSTWCESEGSAPVDCAALLHIAVPGFWGCSEFICDYNACQNPGPDYDFVSTDPGQCQVIRYTCRPGQVAFSNGCGCGCKDLF